MPPMFFQPQFELTQQRFHIRDAVSVSGRLSCPQCPVCEVRERQSQACPPRFSGCCGHWMVQRSKPNFDKPTAPVGRNEWPDNLSIPSGELVGVPRCRAAWTMVATIADLLQTLPSAVGKRGRESSGRSPTCLAGNKRRKSRSWSHTACAGQSLHGQPALQMQLCALATPRASVSDFEAGSNSTAHGNSLASSVTKQALKVLASTPRKATRNRQPCNYETPLGRARTRVACRLEARQDGQKVMPARAQEDPGLGDMSG